MQNTGPTKKFTLGVLLLSAMMLASFLVPGAAPAADAQSSSPCPNYSIQDVFADPSGNWDGDQVNNSDELYNGLNPCIVDTSAFCAGGGNPVCIYYTYTYVGHVQNACQVSINAYPDYDYDGDGISNAVELRNGADPCQHPCPNPSHADLSLNPNGSWDTDGISNAVEVSQGTDPCSGYSYTATTTPAHTYRYVHIYNPCPYYSLADVSAMPTLDWDNDGTSNADEIHRNTSPCQFNASIRYNYVTVQPTKRLPHVRTAPRIVHIAPSTPAVRCPQGYPYFHRDTGLCYANPISAF